MRGRHEGGLCAGHPPPGQGGDAKAAPPEGPRRPGGRPLQGQAPGGGPLSRRPRGGAGHDPGTGPVPERRQPVLEADEAAYRRAFHRVLLSLQEVSDRVEDAGLGTAYVRLDGLEALYGGEDPLVAALLGAVPRDLKPRAGVGDAKFPAFVAARISPALGTTLVPPDAAGFLAPCPVDLLPVPVAVVTEMRRFGLRTLGDVAAMQRESLIDRFGHAGARAWELSMGWDNRPLVPLKYEESFVEHAALPFASASLGLLLAAVDTLLQRAFARPRMQGRYAGRAHLECVLYQAHPWEKQVNFKQPVGDWQRASGIIRGQLEGGPPPWPWWRR